MTQEANKLKDEGNKALLASRFDEAVELYTKAIALDPTQAVFFRTGRRPISRMRRTGLR
jgi:hypothetical protein